MIYDDKEQENIYLFFKALNQKDNRI